MNDDREALVPTGIEGLDEILRGGLPKARLYLLEGAPGTGKTTIALQILRQAVALGSKALYITLSETAEELAAVCKSHGWPSNEVEMFELSDVRGDLSPDTEQTILHAWEAELHETIQLILERVATVKPSLIVFDSLSELRLLAGEPLRYRRQILTLKHYFASRNMTVIMTDDLTGNDGSSDSHLHSLCHGVISVERVTTTFGSSRRRLQVQKMRGIDFIGGYHGYVLRRGGVQVFSRLFVAEQKSEATGEPIASGKAELDALLGGGPRRGTATLVIGPAGSGKSNITLLYVAAACARGEAAVMYHFDERISTLIARASGLGIQLQQYVDSGLLEIRQVDPAEITPGEFAHLIRLQVERRKVSILVIDSLAGYVSALPQEQSLMLQLHELLAYLNQHGVASFLVNTQQSLVGSVSTGGLHVSYLADAIVLLRFFEFKGRVRKAISVLKNRSGEHEDAIRELRIDGDGVRIGRVLEDFSGVLTGVPRYDGESMSLNDGA